MFYAIALGAEVAEPAGRVVSEMVKRDIELTYDRGVYVILFQYSRHVINRF